MQFGESADWRDEDLYAIGAQPLPGRRASPYRRLPWIRVTLTSAVFIALIAIYAPEGGPRDVAAPHSLLGEPPELLTPPSPWRELANSDLEVVVIDQRLAHLPLSQAARAHEDGMLQDVIEIGTFRSAKPHLRVLLERDSGNGGAESGVAARSFFVEMAVRAAHAGLAVARSLPEEPLATRNERYEVARVWLENGRTRTCLAFRTADTMQPTRRVGWLCGAEVSREDLACAIEGLVLRHRETGLLLGRPLAPEVQPACLRPLPVTERESPPDHVASNGSPTTLASGTFFPPLPPRRPPGR